MVVVVTLNVVNVAPGPTVAAPGTVSVVLVFVSVTFAPPAGAGCVRVTVQMLGPFCPTLAGLQARVDTSTGASRLTLVFAELLLYVAVIVALWLVAMVLTAVTIKVPAVAPLLISTPDGAGRLILVLLIETALQPTDG